MNGVRTVEFLNDSLRVRYFMHAIGDGVVKPYGLSEGPGVLDIPYDSLAMLPNVPDNLEKQDVYRIGIPRIGTLVLAFSEDKRKKDIGVFFEE